MRALRSCDFCGEQAVGTFEMVPEELEPTEAERRRVVLCESCKETLQTLIEPLIDRAGGNADSQGTPSKDRTTGETPPEGESTAAGTGSTDLIGASADEDGSLLGTTDETDPDDSGSEAAVAASSRQGESETDSKPDGAESATSAESSESSQSQSGERPDNYGQVLRLLRNREFPMTREEIVTIATSAYQLDSRNVQAVIDEAIDRGEFVEADGQLQQA